MLWAFATLGLQPEENLLAGLTVQAMAVRHDFNPQNISNTLWAFTTLGRQPDKQLLAGLTEQVIAVRIALKPQDIANMLWVTCFLSIHSPDVASRLAHALEPCIAALASSVELVIQLQLQLHQFFVSCDLDGLRAGVPDSTMTLKETLGPECRAAFVGGTTQSSRSQTEVSQTLRGMGLSVEDEARCPTSGYSLDMLVHSTPVPGQSGGESTTGDTEGWAVEFDGPSHFLACGAPTGATLIKRHHVHLLGYSLVSIPYWEWANLRAGEREEYLKVKLQSAKSAQAAAMVSTSTTSGEGEIDLDHV